MAGFILALKVKLGIGNKLLDSPSALPVENALYPAFGDKEESQSFSPDRDQWKFKAHRDYLLQRTNRVTCFKLRWGRGLSLIHI